MDKPVSLSVKDYIIRKMAVKLMVSEKVIDTVIGHQFSSANEALRSNKSVEISGFGKFVFNERRAFYKLESSLAAQKNIEALLAKELSEKERRNYELKLVSVNKTVNSLKPKLYDFKIESNKGGMEK